MTPAIRFRDARIEMAHGAGGKASRRLIEGLIKPLLTNPALEPLSDAALIDLNGVQLAFSTDAFVVKPLRFSGGSIGDLAVNGTINDLAVSGVRPQRTWVNPKARVPISRTPFSTRFYVNHALHTVLVAGSSPQPYDPASLTLLRSTQEDSSTASNHTGSY
jgi:hypothetical protein